MSYTTVGERAELYFRCEGRLDLISAKLEEAFTAIEDDSGPRTIVEYNELYDCMCLCDDAASALKRLAEGLV